MAEKRGIRVVVQCKLYARPVGNKAVQEIAAAKAHEQAHYGVVVSNNSYTQDAEQLASTNRILLLHYTDLCELDSTISLPPPTPEVVWYYANGDGQIGPQTLQNLVQALTSLPNAKEILVWRDGFLDWKQGNDVPELKPLFRDNAQPSSILGKEPPPLPSRASSANSTT